MRVKTGSDQFVMDTAMSDDVPNKPAEENHANLDQMLEDKEIIAPNPPTTTNNHSCMENGAPDQTTEGKVSTEKESDSSKEDNMEEEFPVRCPCGCNEDDGLMIMCSTCNKWQHGICFLITDENKAPAVHTCEECCKLGNQKEEPTDPYLTDMSPIAVQATCLWRRTLMACLEFKRILAPQLARRLGIETTVAQGLINRLDKEGFVSSTNRGKK